MKESESQEVEPKEKPVFSPILCHVQNSQIYGTNSRSNINDRTISESHHGPPTTAANGGHPLTINRSMMCRTINRNTVGDKL